MIYFLGIVILVALSISLFVLYSGRKKLNRKRKNDDISFDYSEEILLPKIKKLDSEEMNQFIQTNNGGFQIKGNTEKFIIKKNRYEFLVENGRIVACKNTDLHNEFIYYKKVN